MVIGPQAYGQFTHEHEVDSEEIAELRKQVEFLESSSDEEERKLIEIIRREKITAVELEMLISLRRIQL